MGRMLSSVILVDEFMICTSLRNKSITPEASHYVMPQYVNIGWNLPFQPTERR